MKFNIVFLCLLLSLTTAAQRQEAINISNSKGFYTLAEQPISEAMKDSAIVWITPGVFKNGNTAMPAKGFIQVNNTACKITDGKAIAFVRTNKNITIAAGDSGTTYKFLLNNMICKPGHLYRLTIYLLPKEKIDFGIACSYHAQVAPRELPPLPVVIATGKLQLVLLASIHLVRPGVLINNTPDTIQVLRIESTMSGIASEVRINGRWIEFETSRNIGDLYPYYEKLPPGRAIAFQLQQYHRAVDSGKGIRIPYRLRYQMDTQTIYSNEITVHITKTAYYKLLYSIDTE